MKKEDTVADGRFLLLSMIGKGREDEVWKAVDQENNGKVVALKIGSEKADTEYKNGISFQHDCLLRPMEFFEGIVVMPYYPGRSMDSICGYLDERMTWQLLADISSALDYLHERGFCHSDVRPSHILWSGSRFILSGLGHCHPERMHSVTEPQDRLFTAPEGAHGAASDIWALAASVFLMVMGRPVFGGVGGRTQHPDSPLPFMRKSMPELSRLVARCLDYNKEMRPTAKEIQETALAQSAICLSQEDKRPMKHSEADQQVTNDHFWPDDMKEG